MPRRRPINPANISLKIEDILTNYGGPEIGKAILKNLVEQGPLGVGQVLRLDERDVDVLDASGSVTGTRRAMQIIFNQTGQAFQNLEEAMNFATERGIVSYSRLSQNPEYQVGRQLPFGGVRSDMRKINIDIIKRAKMQPNGKVARDLRKLGLGFLMDDAGLTDRNGQTVLSEFLEIRPSTIKIPFQSTAEDYLKNFRNSAGELLGTLLEGDDGFTLYQYAFPGKDLLTQEQILKLRAYAGLPEINTQSAIDALKKGVDPEKGIESKIMKLGKRQKGTYSPRQLSVTGKGLSTFMRGGTTDLADTILRVDTRAELLFAGLSGKVTNNALKSSLADAFNSLDYNFYRNLDLAASEAYGNFAEIFGNEIKQGDYNRLAQILESVKGSTSVTSDFEGAVKADTRLSKNVKDRVGVLLSKMEVEVDGALRGSAAYFDEYAASLQTTFDRLNTKKKNLTATESELRKLDDIHKTLKAFATQNKDGNWVTDRNIYGMTARVNFKQGAHTPQVKGRLGFVDEIVTKSGKKYAFVTPDVNIKKEASLAQGIFLDVLGRDKGIDKYIAPDIQSLVQYSSSFIDVDPTTGLGSAPKVTQMYVQQQLQQLDEILQSRIVPTDVIDSIIQKMETSEEAAFNAVYRAGKRGTQLTHQQSVKAMQNALLTGNFNTEAYNALFNEFISRTYTVKRVGSSGRTKTFVIPKTPDLYRFDIESEASSLMGTNEARLLQYGRDTEVVKMGSGTSDISLPVTRINNHRMLFSSQNSIKYQASHGGFDFDDKGMPSMRSYVDTSNGERRLALFSFRQPPSIGEYSVSSFLKDQETLNNLFGHSDEFKSTLRNLADTDQEAAELLQYMEMKPVDKASGREFAKLHRKYAGVGVSNKDINAGNYYGTAQSKLLSSNNSLFKDGQTSADRVIMSVYERMYGTAPAELAEDVMRALNITKSGSPLALTAETFKALGDKEKLEFAPHYIQGNIYRMFAESKEIPYTAEEKNKIASIINRYGLSSNITANMDEANYRVGLGNLMETLLSNTGTRKRRRSTCRD